MAEPKTSQPTSSKDVFARGSSPHVHAPRIFAGFVRLSSSRSQPFKSERRSIRSSAREQVGGASLSTQPFSRKAVADQPALDKHFCRWTKGGGYQWLGVLGFRIHCKMLNSGDAKDLPSHRRPQIAARVEACYWTCDLLDKFCSLRCKKQSEEAWLPATSRETSSPYRREI